MTIPFLVIAAAMVVVALACVLVPMLRTARREGRPHAPFWLALALVLVMPPVVLGSYLALGTPQALQPLPTPAPTSLAQATRQLRQSLENKPNDVQGWMLLSQAYSAQNKPGQARAALRHVLKLKPNDPTVMVAWVEATAEADPAHRIDAASRKMLQHALKIDPTQQRALWLLGISDFQRQHYADAVQQWGTLLPLLPTGSKVATTVKQQLAEARVRAGGNQTGRLAAAYPAAAGSVAALAASDPVALTVTVKLDPGLAGKVAPGDTLFVFARAVDGPPMPLAVARLPVSSLPARVTLTDAMAMTPRHELSNYPEVVIAARISKSGKALPRKGDLESAAVKVATSQHRPVALTINHVD